MSRGNAYIERRRRYHDKSRNVSKPNGLRPTHWSGLVKPSTVSKITPRGTLRTHFANWELEVIGSLNKLRFKFHPRSKVYWETHQSSSSQYFEQAQDSYAQSQMSRGEWYYLTKDNSWQVKELLKAHWPQNQERKLSTFPTWRQSCSFEAERCNDFDLFWYRSVSKTYIS